MIRVRRRYARGDVRRGAARRAADRAEPLPAAARHQEQQDQNDRLLHAVLRRANVSRP